MAITYNFPSHVKGDTYPEQTFVFKLNGVAIDLTGATIKMMLKWTKDDSIAALTLITGSGITITDAATGTWKIDTQVIDIGAGKYVYDVQATLADGTIGTYVAGSWEMVQDITT
jgi:hypothetical protein